MDPKRVAPKPWPIGAGVSSDRSVTRGVIATWIDHDGTGSRCDDALITADPAYIFEGFQSELSDKEVCFRLFREGSLGSRRDDTFEQTKAGGDSERKALVRRRNKVDGLALRAGLTGSLDHVRAVRQTGKIEIRTPFSLMSKVTRTLQGVSSGACNGKVAGQQAAVEFYDEGQLSLTARHLRYLFSCISHGRTQPEVTTPDCCQQLLT